MTIRGTTRRLRGRHGERNNGASELLSDRNSRHPLDGKGTRRMEGIGEVGTVLLNQSAAIGTSLPDDHGTPCTSPNPRRPGARAPTMTKEGDDATLSLLEMGASMDTKHPGSGGSLILAKPASMRVSDQTWGGHTGGILHQSLVKQTRPTEEHIVTGSQPILQGGGGGGFQTEESRALMLYGAKPMGPAMAVPPGSTWKAGYNRATVRCGDPSPMALCGGRQRKSAIGLSTGRH